MKEEMCKKGADCDTVELAFHFWENDPKYGLSFLGKKVSFLSQVDSTLVQSNHLNFRELRYSKKEYTPPKFCNPLHPTSLSSYRKMVGL